MITENGLPFINEYVDSINKILRGENKELSRIQATWLKFILLGILITNTVSWAQFSRYSLCRYTVAAISWMFRKAKLPWNRLLLASIKHIIEVYKITSCNLIIDDSDRERSKHTTAIAKLHKLKDKLTGGYLYGQNLVFLVLVSKEVTLPVGYKLYEPDPKLQAYNQEEKRLKKKGIAKKYRPQKPERSKDYPTKIDLSLELLREFVSDFPKLKINSVSADAAYSTRHFIKQAAMITKQKQIISQIKSSQNVEINGKITTVKAFFKNYGGKKTIVKLRGTDKEITYISIKLKVTSHDAAYRVVALKYDNEEEYRYIIANDASWQAIDIIQAYALRWLVEVFIQDWKSHEGWNQLAKQPGIDGSVRAIILSLLCDHALLTYPEQIALFKKREPACTVGSLHERVIMDSLLAFIHNIICSENPQALFNEHKEHIMQVFALRSSKKHMRHMYADGDQADSANCESVDMAA